MPLSYTTPVFTPAEQAVLNRIREHLNELLRHGLPSQLFEQVNAADKALLEALNIHEEAKRLS